MAELSEKWYKKNPWARGRKLMEAESSADKSRVAMSIVMKSVMGYYLFQIRRDEKRAFSRTGVQIKALIYLVWMILVGTLSYQYANYDVGTQSTFEKTMSIIISLVGPLWLLLPPLWLSNRYTRWSFWLVRFCDFAVFATLGYVDAGAVHDRPVMLPIAFCVMAVSCLWIVSANLQDKLKMNRLAQATVILAATFIVIFMVSQVAPHMSVVGVVSGMVLAVFSVASFFLDMNAIDNFSRTHKLHSRYEWAAAYALVFDVVLCVAGLVKASAQK